MGELADIIQAWLDADPARDVPDFVRAGGGRKAQRNTIYEILKREPSKEPRRRSTLQLIAKATGKPYPVVRDAAFRDAGQSRTTETNDPRVIALVGLMDQASDTAVEAAIAAATAAIAAIDGRSS